ncbi:MAG TPA: hypothetical protein VJP83_07000, partial [Terriglobales bacterium]|nr:hypothetical protein [Terriglobales bacterium]
MRDYQRNSPQQPKKRQHLPDGKRILQQAFQQNGSRRREKGRSERAQLGNSGEPWVEISAQGANHQKQERRQAEDSKFCEILDERIVNGKFGHRVGSTRPIRVIAHADAKEGVGTE